MGKLPNAPTSFLAVKKEYIKCIFLFRQGPPPPSFGQCPKENIFFPGRCSLMRNVAEVMRKIAEVRYFSEVYFRKMYPTCVSSKLCEFI